MRAAMRPVFLTTGFRKLTASNARLIRMVLPSNDERARIYQGVVASITALIGQEDDPIAGMATVACELHHAFPYYHWTGFYRALTPSMLVIGPYQGKHGCLRIPFGRGVCGSVAASGKTALVANVNLIENHIACSASTQSEIVVPIFNERQEVTAVLDVDSDCEAAFTAVDQHYLETICGLLSQQYFNGMA